MQYSPKKGTVIIMDNNNEVTKENVATEESVNKNFFVKCKDYAKGVYNKCVGWFKEKTKNVKWKEVWDKVTTGILIFLMTSPLLILAYIFLWFILRN